MSSTLQGNYKCCIGQADTRVENCKFTICEMPTEQFDVLKSVGP